MKATDSQPSIAILYFSGAGGTKLVAELLGGLLAARVPGDCRACSIHEAGAMEAAEKAGFLVFCYPTYFLKPAPAMAEFMASLPEGGGGGRGAALLTTYELYTGNSNRYAAKLLAGRGFAPAGSFGVRAPGTDVTCVLPDWLCGWLYRFEDRFPEKLAEIARRISAKAGLPSNGGKIPAPKWYTPLSWPLQVLILDGFIHWKYRMRALPERCNGCGLCIQACHRGSWRRAEGGLVHDGDSCDLCLRCLHHCPGKAIVLKEGLKDNRRLDQASYRRLMQETKERL